MQRRNPTTLLVAALAVPVVALVVLGALAASEGDDRQALGLGLVAAAVSIVLALLAVRSITRPLRRLAADARDMAEHRLPRALEAAMRTAFVDGAEPPPLEPVRAPAGGSIADVAAALDSLQRSAVDLALEQSRLRRNISESFVNLARRNQNLLGRQLDFITELERNETDADTLEELFRLDHLATRMRRNAESLLVLAGIEPPRQWTNPVRIGDVVRASLGEVEDYQRVVVRALDATSVAGSAAADLAHVLAELIENALSFSPADRTVEVRGRVTLEGGYDLSVIDAGMGMSATDVQAANERLTGRAPGAQAPSRFLGHEVAGRLGARHGLRILLESSPREGTTALVSVPPHLIAVEPLSEPSHRPEAPAPRHGVRTAAAAATTPVPSPPEAPAAAAAPTFPAMGSGTDSPAAQAPEIGPLRVVQGSAPSGEGGRTPSGLPRRVVAEGTDGPPPSAPERTASGLSRRVPGAQLPATGPLPMQRADEPGSDAPRPGGDVASFLSNFGSHPNGATNGHTAEEDR